MSRALTRQDGIITLAVDEAVNRYRIGVIGSDDDHVRYPNYAYERPLLIFRDGADAAEDEADGQLLGVGPDSGVVKLNGTCNQLELLTPEDPATDATGKARTLPSTVAGLYWLIGLALEDGVDEQEIAFQPMVPRLLARGLSKTADSSTVTNTTDETTFSTGTLPLAGATLQAGDVIRARFAGNVPSTNGADTLTLRAKLGTETLVTAGPVDVADNDQFELVIEIVVVTAGATVRASGTTLLGVPGTAALTPFILDDAAEDISAAVNLLLTAQWSAASADNQVVLTHASVELRRPSEG